MTSRQYASNRCSRHVDVFLVDLLEDDGTISRTFPACTPVDLVNVVRGLHRRKPS